MERTYVLATDGTETSERSEDYVLETLDPEETELLLVTALEDIDEDQLDAVESDVNLETLDSKREKEAEAMLQEKANRYESAGFTVSWEVLHGDAGEEICSIARNVGAHGIFMGRGEHSKLGQLFYGSVSHYVLLNAPTSVIITPSADSETETESDVEYRASRMDK